MFNVAWLKLIVMYSAECKPSEWDMGPIYEDFHFIFIYCLYHCNARKWYVYCYDKVFICPPRDILFLAATKQLYEWFSPSVCLFVCLSVRPSHLFVWVITNGKSDVNAKGQGHRSKVKVTEVMTPFSRFRSVTPVWIHMLQWNDAYSLMLLRRGALLFFKVICQISRSHGSKNRWIWPRLGVSGL